MMKSLHNRYMTFEWTDFRFDALLIVLWVAAASLTIGGIGLFAAGLGALLGV